MTCSQRRISRPASAVADTPSGRFRTGSIANRSTRPRDTTSLAFEWDSTATVAATPLRISITAVATPNRPSAATVWTGRCTAPSWSGTYSSKMLVPSSMSSEQHTKESISLRGSTPASAYAPRAASNISSL